MLESHVETNRDPPSPREAEASNTTVRHFGSALPDFSHNSVQREKDRGEALLRTWASPANLKNLEYLKTNTNGLGPSPYTIPNQLSSQP